MRSPGPGGPSPPLPDLGNSVLSPGLCTGHIFSNQTMCHPGNPDIVHFKGSRLGQASPPPRSLRHRTADTGVGRSLGGRLGRHGLASSIPGATDSMPQCDDHGCPHMFPNVPWGQNHLWSGSRYGGGRIDACLSGGARRQSPPARCHSSEGPSRWSRAGDSTVSLPPALRLPAEAPAPQSGSIWRGGKVK